MKVPVKWLSEFIQLDRSVAEVARLLTMSGLEVEAIIEIGQLPPEIITARIADQRPHPNAERLTICQVYVGTGLRQIVCGARNMGAGDVVVLAQPGAVLPGGHRIEVARLRGERSEGMLCSARELGLSDEHAGLLILDPATPVGQPFSSVFPGADTVFDLNITPNRPDCLSILGVARELSALTGSPLNTPATPAFSVRPGPAPARVTGESPENCPTYYGRVVSGIQVGPSPAWLVDRLSAAGLRSINNVVDATNYIMLERGQPLHAFDLEKLAGRHILVRQARAGERLLCLDGVERTLEARDLAICDDQGIVAIAGVMGGELSSVREGTQTLFLEAAWFAPEAVRATARRTGLHTDASHRFERGVDPEGVLPALDALTALIESLAGGVAEGEVLSARVPRPPRAPVFMNPDRVNSLLGLSVPSERMCRHLQALNMRVRPESDGFRVEAPSYRLDIETEADLAEEVARLEGYDRIPTTRPLVRMQSPDPGARRKRVRELVEYLAARGLDQVVNYGFIGPALLEAFRLEEGDVRRRVTRLLNPLSEEMSIMRTLLLPSLVKAAVYNERREVADLKIFEVGTVFLPPDSGSRPVERYHLGVLLMGNREPRAWTATRGEVDIYDLKGVLESLFTHLRISGLRFEGRDSEPYLAPGQGWTVSLEEIEVGVMGALHPEVARAVGLEHAAYVLEIDLERVWAAPAGTIRFKALPRFPAIERDLALIVDAGTSAADLMALIREAGGALLERIAVFDLFRGRNIPEGKKSIAFNLVFRSEERTLVEGEVQEHYDRILRVLESRTGARLRG